MPAVPVQRDQFHNLAQATYDERAFLGEYDGSNNIIYAAFALPGSSASDRVWQLKKMTYSGTNLTSITWPQLNGKASREYAFAYADRASYTYS